MNIYKIINVISLGFGGKVISDSKFMNQYNQYIYSGLINGQKCVQVFLYGFYFFFGIYRNWKQFFNCLSV